MNISTTLPRSADRNLSAPKASRQPVATEMNSQQNDTVKISEKKEDVENMHLLKSAKPGAIVGSAAGLAVGVAAGLAGGVVGGIAGLAFSGVTTVLGAVAGGVLAGWAVLNRAEGLWGLLGAVGAGAVGALAGGAAGMAAGGAIGAAIGAGGGIAAAAMGAVGVGTAGATLGGLATATIDVVRNPEKYPELLKQLKES